jgi:hypothetical protein
MTEKPNMKFLVIIMNRMFHRTLTAFKQAFDITHVSHASPPRTTWRFHWSFRTTECHNGTLMANKPWYNWLNMFNQV